MTYTARPGSVPARAITALAKAGEPLTRQQLGTALGCNPDHVDAHLAMPVRLGAILRSKDFGTTRWSLPPGSSKPDQGDPLGFSAAAIAAEKEAADDKPAAKSKPRKPKPAAAKEETPKPKARRKAKRAQRKARPAVLRIRIKPRAKEALPPPRSGAVRPGRRHRGLRPVLGRHARDGAWRRARVRDRLRRHAVPHPLPDLAEGAGRRVVPGGKP